MFVAGLARPFDMHQIATKFCTNLDVRHWNAIDPPSSSRLSACRRSRFRFTYRRLIMANLTLFDPSTNDLIDPFFRRFFASRDVMAPLDTQSIRVDISETPEQYSVKADIPGVKKEDIHVRIERNSVQIDATMNSEKEEKDPAGRIIRSERYSGAVSRAFSLANDVDDAKATAKYDGGVLTLSLPKKTAATAKQLSIQ
jgi:HSP20 family protein